MPVMDEIHPDASGWLSPKASEYMKKREGERTDKKRVEGTHTETQGPQI